MGQNLVQITQGRILERATEALFCISIMALVGCVWGDRLKAKRVRGIILGKSKAAECIFDVEPIVASAIVWGCESVCVLWMQSMWALGCVFDVKVKSLIVFSLSPRKWQGCIVIPLSFPAPWRPQLCHSSAWENGSANQSGLHYTVPPFQTCSFLLCHFSITKFELFVIGDHGSWLVW